MDTSHITRLTQMRDAYANHGDQATCDVADALTAALSELRQLGEADRRAGAAERKLAAAEIELANLRRVAAWVDALKGRVGLQPGDFLEDLEERLFSGGPARTAPPMPSTHLSDEMGDFPAYDRADAMPVDEPLYHEPPAPRVVVAAPAPAPQPVAAAPVAAHPASAVGAKPVDAKAQVTF